MKAVVYPVMNPIPVPLKVKMIRSREAIPNIFPAIVRGCLILRFIPHPTRLNRKALCASLPAQEIPPMTTMAMKLVWPPTANGTFKPISTAVTKNAVRLKSTIENISFQRLVRNFSFTIFSPKALQVYLSLYNREHMLPLTILVAGVGFEPTTFGW